MSHKDFKKGVEVKKLDGSGLTVVVISARWNASIVNAMKDGCIGVLCELGVKGENIIEVEVPGAYELPFAAKSIILHRRAPTGTVTPRTIDAVVALGCLIKGETMHLSQAQEQNRPTTCCSAKRLIILSQVGLSTGVPVIFGVLTVLNEEQAKVRSGLTAGGHNHGEDYGYAAVEMAQYRYNMLVR